MVSQCRTLRGNELRGVDEGVRGEEGGVVCSAQHNWNCVELQSIESLLRNVIFTNGVLKTDVESKIFPLFTAIQGLKQLRTSIVH